MARDLELDTKVTGLVPVIAGLDRLAAGVDEVGDQAKQTERELSRLSREITATEAKMALLTKQFNASGDSKFVKEFGRERKSLAGLKAMNRELEQAEAKAKKTEAALLGVAKALVPGGGPSGQAITGGGKTTKGIVGSLRIPGLDLLTAIGPEGLAGLGAGVGVPVAAEAGGLAAAGGLLTAGLGGIGAGVAIAAQDKEVRDAFSMMFAHVAQDAKADARVFIDPLVRSADIFGEAWRRQEPGISKVFTNLSKSVEPLAGGLAAAVENMLPGLEKAAIASRPLLKVFSTDFLPKFGQGIGDLFDDIAASGDGAADALRDVATGTKLLLDGTGEAVKSLSELNHLLHEADTVGGLLPGTLERSTNVLKFFKATSFFGFLGALADSKKATEDAAEPADLLGEAYRALDEQAKKAAEGENKLAQFMNAASKAVRDQSQAIDDALGNLLSLEEANLAVDRTYFDLKHSIEENGKSLDSHTEKGNANRETIRQMIEVYVRAKEAAIAAAGGVLAGRDAIDKANADLRKHIDQVRAWAVALGLPKAQIDAILAGYYALLNAPAIRKSVSIGGNIVGGTGRRAVAAGGVFEHADVGTLRDAGVYPPTNPGRFMIAEPQTGGEAFIPKFGDRGRSMSILQHAANWHGADVVPRQRYRTPTAGTGGGGGGAGGGGSVAYTGPTPSGLQALFLSWLQEQIRVGYLKVS